jgi:general secretion pathway protein N
MAISLRMPRRGRPTRAFSPTVTGWAESTHAELAWKSSRHAVARWATWGGVLGLLFALVAFAPASWLAAAVASATDQRLLLAEVRGTVWNGSAIPVLSAGPDSRDAATLPGRLQWTIGWRGFGAELRLSQPCCMAQPLVFGLQPGLGRFRARLLPQPGGAAARWPAAWLSGLGTPWNTLQLNGNLFFVSPGMTIEWVQGRWRMDGRADIELRNASSRLSPLDPLGSYRFSISGDPANPGTSVLSLATMEGALRLSGSGTWGATGVRFRGEASADAGDEAALNNLLNIIGRRSGARSVIAIG